MLVLPTPDQVMLSLLGLEGGLAHSYRALQAWSNTLAWKGGTVSTAPWVTDLWVWLPLQPPEVGETKETGRYYLHAQTCRIYDAWQGTWCRSNWRPRKNSPVVSVQWNTPTLEWVQLGKILALTAQSPAQRTPVAGGAAEIEADAPVAKAGGGGLWALAVDPGLAAFLREYEARHGTGTGCLDVFALRWTKHGHPSDKSLKYPYEPLPAYRVDPERG